MATQKLPSRAAQQAPRRAAPYRVRGSSRRAVRSRASGARQGAGWRDAGLFVALSLVVVAVARVPSLTYLDYGFGLLIVYALGALSVNVIFHYLGEINLSAIAGLAVGGYIYAIALSHGMVAPAGFLLAVLGAGLFGCLMGLPNLRLHGIQLALVTLAAAWALPELIGAMGSVTGAQRGMTVASTFSIAGTTITAGSWSFVVLATIVLIAVGLLLTAGLRTAFGRRLLLVSGAEPASQAFGMRLGAWRIAIWGASGALAGVAGCFYAVSSGFVGPSEFSFQTSLLIMAAGIVGGAGWLGGALIAGALIGLLPDALSSMSGGGEYVLLGALIVAAIAMGKGGLFGVLYALVNRVRPDTRSKRRVARRPEVRRQAEGDEQGAGFVVPPALRMQIDGSGAKAPNRELVVAVDRVSLQFGGVQALSEVSLCLVQGEWLALAGPNGSGKSSLLNCISGAYIATGGRINIGGKEVTRKSPAIRGRLGVARTFQTPRLAAGLSIAENVWLGGATRSVVGDRLRRGEAVWTAVHEALEEWDIERYADNLPANVPYGARKQAELARLSVKASTASSQLFLMDEPAAGLSPEEREELVTGLRSFRLKHADAAVIIVEHDVQLLGQLCDSAVALDYGKVVTHGTFADVFASDTVVLSFIGREDCE